MEITKVNAMNCMIVLYELIDTGKVFTLFEPRKLKSSVWCSLSQALKAYDMHLECLLQQDIHPV